MDDSDINYDYVTDLVMQEVKCAFSGYDSYSDNDEEDRDIYSEDDPIDYDLISRIVEREAKFHLLGKNKSEHKSGLHESDWVNEPSKHVDKTQPENIALPVLTLHYHDIPVWINLRTGSHINIVDLRFAEQVGFPIKHISLQTRDTLMNDLPSSAVGEVHVELTGHGISKFQLSALVVKDHYTDITGGMPFLEDNRITLNIPQDQIVICDSIVICYGVCSSIKRVEMSALPDANLHPSSLANSENLTERETALCHSMDMNDMPGEPYLESDVQCISSSQNSENKIRGDGVHKCGYESNTTHDTHVDVQKSHNICDEVHIPRNEDAYIVYDNHQLSVHERNEGEFCERNNSVDSHKIAENTVVNEEAPPGLDNDPLKKTFNIVSALMLFTDLGKQNIPISDDTIVQVVDTIDDVKDQKIEDIGSDRDNDVKATDTSQILQTNLKDKKVTGNSQVLPMNTNDEKMMEIKQMLTMNAKDTKVTEISSMQSMNVNDKKVTEISKMLLPMKVKEASPVLERKVVQEKLPEADSLGIQMKVKTEKVKEASSVPQKKVNHEKVTVTSSVLEKKVKD